MKVSVTLFGHRTSLTLEPEFYEGLKEMADKQNIPVYRLIEQLDQARKEKPLSSYIRTQVLVFYKERTGKNG